MTKSTSKKHTPAQIECLRCAVHTADSTVGESGLVAVRWPEGKALVRRGELSDGWGRKGVKVYRITDTGRSIIAQIAGGRGS